MDAKVFRDLRNRDAGLAVHPDAHDVIAELLGEGLGHSGILSCQPPRLAMFDVTYSCTRPPVLHGRGCIKTRLCWSWREVLLRTSDRLELSSNSLEPAPFQIRMQVVLKLGNSPHDYDSGRECVPRRPRKKLGSQHTIASSLQVTDYAWSSAGKLSFLLAGRPDSSSDKIQSVKLVSQDKKLMAPSVKICGSVGGSLHCEVHVPTGANYRIEALDSSGKLYRVGLPIGLANKKGKFSGFISRYILRSPAYAMTLQREIKRLPKKISVITRSDSIEILDEENLGQQLLFTRRGSKDTVRGSLLQNGASVFSVSEFSETLLCLPDGETLWDCRLGSNSGRRLQYWGSASEEPRRLMQYPWYWMGDEGASARAKVYWTKDGHLALKIVKKGLKAA